MINKITKFINQLRGSKGFLLKKEIEMDYPHIDIKCIMVIENLTLTKKELNDLKEKISMSDYRFPFNLGITEEISDTLFLKLLQVKDISDNKYAVIIDLQSGYDTVRGKPIIYLEKIKDDLLSVSDTQEYYTF